MEITKTAPIPNPENDARRGDAVGFLQQDWMHKGHYVSSCNHWLNTGLNTKLMKMNSNYATL